MELIVATTHLLYNPKRGDIKLAQTQLILAEIEKMAYIKHNPLTLQPEYLPIIFAGDMNYSPENGNKIRGSTLTAIIQILETLREAYGIDTNNQSRFVSITNQNYCFFLFY